MPGTLPRPLRPAPTRTYQSAKSPPLWLLLETPPFPALGKTMHAKNVATAPATCPLPAHCQQMSASPRACLTPRLNPGDLPPHVETHSGVAHVLCLCAVVWVCSCRGFVRLHEDHARKCRPCTLPPHLRPTPTRTRSLISHVCLIGGAFFFGSGFDVLL